MTRSAQTRMGLTEVEVLTLPRSEQRWDHTRELPGFLPAVRQAAGRRVCTSTLPCPPPESRRRSVLDTFAGWLIEKGLFIMADILRASIHSNFF